DCDRRCAVVARGRNALDECHDAGRTGGSRLRHVRSRDQRVGDDDGRFTAATAAAAGGQQQGTCRQAGGRARQLDGHHDGCSFRARAHCEPGSGVFRYGKPGRNGTTAWSTPSCTSSEAAPAGTLEGLQAEVTPATPGMLLSLSVSPSPLATHKPPSIATSAMSTTSSLGRRPLGNPAKSVPAGEVFRLPTMARRFWL